LLRDPETAEAHLPCSCASTGSSEDTAVGRDEAESLVAVMRTWSVKAHAHRGLHALQQRIARTP